MKKFFAGFISWTISIAMIGFYLVAMDAIGCLWGKSFFAFLGASIFMIIFPSIANCVAVFSAISIWGWTWYNSILFFFFAPTFIYYVPMVLFIGVAESPRLAPSLYKIGHKFFKKTEPNK